MRGEWKIDILFSGVSPMSNQATIWHYPRCSKSRKTLAILRDHGLTTEVRRYLEDPPSPEEVAAALTGLDSDPLELVRTSEELFSELALDADALDAASIADLLAEHPKLIQRPVVFTDRGTVIGRPPEKVYEILPPRS